MTWAQHDTPARPVERILTTRQRDPEADTTSWEQEIDHLVYKLYDLTPEEIAIVEDQPVRSELRP